MNQKKRSVTIIESSRSCFRFDISELWQYRDLIGLFVYRDFVLYYKQTILGPLWWLIQPLCTTGMFTLIFSVIARIPTESLPPSLFYLAGIVVWNYFADCFQKTSAVLTDNSAILGKVYFPRLAIPIAILLFGLFRVVLQLGLFTVFYLLFWLCGAPVLPTLWLFFLPFLFLYIALFGLGTGLFVASMTSKYRDLVMTLPFLTQLWMYASAVIFPLSQVPAGWQWMFMLNPMVFPIELFRKMVFGNGIVHPNMIGTGILATIIILILGLISFNKVERNFTDTI